MNDEDVLVQKLLDNGTFVPIRFNDGNESIPFIDLGVMPNTTKIRELIKDTWPNAKEPLTSLCDFADALEQTLKESVSEAVSEAYDRGWVKAATWSNREDLLSDMASSVYEIEKEVSLSGITKRTV